MKIIFMPERKKVRIQQLSKIENEIRAKISEAEAFRAQYEKDWLINREYLLGNSDKVWWSPTERQVKLIKPPQQKDLVCRNILLPAVRKIKSRLLSSMPTLIAVPMERSEIAKERAKLIEQIIYALHEQLQLQRKYRDLANYLVEHGIGFLKVFWDDTKGVELDKGLKTGDINIEVRNAFEILVPEEKTWEDVKWIVDVKEVDAKVVEQKYKLKLDVKEGDKVLVEEYWEKPSITYPNGRYIVFVNKKIEYYTENNPYNFPEIGVWSPLIYFPFGIYNTSLIYPQSFVTQARPLQKIYNLISHQIYKIIRNMGTIKWLVEENSLLHATSLDNSTDEVVEYRQGFNPPVQSRPMGMPAHLFIALDKVWMELENLVGQHSIKYPARERTATEIHYIIEQDETELAPDLNLFFEQVCLAGKLMLTLISKYYQEERELKYVDEKVLRRIKVRGDDLAGLGKEIIIDLQISSKTIYSKVLQQEQIRKDYQMGLFGVPGSPEARAKVLKALEYADMDIVFEEDIKEIERQVAQWENSQIEKGLTVRRREFDNDLLHLEELERRMKDLDWFALSPEIQAGYFMHRQEHLRALENMREKMAETQMMQNMTQETIQKMAQKAPQGTPQGTI